ncbi:hypothetical protein AVEN_46679-1 [Araneus ventricosus]|uniref:Uncharacterized protein n=1 Tax=Araneus ventricosus TaxID=182803 RepID=A0A4Y2UMG9_ARAVE|nr:hypothetical protein AVEN_46679-1 [Araneus ventricosus]
MQPIAQQQQKMMGILVQANLFFAPSEYQSKCNNRSFFPKKIRLSAAVMDGASGEGIELTLENRRGAHLRNYERQCQGHRRQVLAEGGASSGGFDAREHNGGTSAGRGRNAR